MFFSWFTKLKARKEAARRLHEATRRLHDAAVVQSRMPVFYERLGVADSIDGRFDLLALHVFLMMDRLNDLGPEGCRLAQTLFDRMFGEIDLTLREMGVGDLGIPKHMKKMMKAFNGRAHHYHEALAARSHDALLLAVTRNVYRVEGESIPYGADELARYTMAAHEAFAAMDLMQFQTGAPAFPPVAQTRKEAAVA